MCLKCLALLAMLEKSEAEQPADVSSCESHKSCRRDLWLRPVTKRNRSEQRRGSTSGLTAPDQSSPKKTISEATMAAGSPPPVTLPVTLPVNQHHNAGAACFCYTMKMGLSMGKIKERSSDLDCCLCQRGIIFMGAKKRELCSIMRVKADLCPPISIET